MVDRYFSLPHSERNEILVGASQTLARAAFYLEKDIWVVWALDTLYRSPIGAHIAFKGGNSLSKAYHVIERFSEDVDITYDIRQLMPEMTREFPTGLPPNRSQAEKWTAIARKKLPLWISTVVKPIIDGALLAEGMDGISSIVEDNLIIGYKPATQSVGEYVLPKVVLEFGARATGEPTQVRDVFCDVAPEVKGVMFPIARPRVMAAERTFWEKATAMHVYCLQQRVRGDRMSRHWYDVANLADAGVAMSAFSDRQLGRAVAQHKSLFFIEKDSEHNTIDYHAAVNGGLRLVPQGDAVRALEDDYRDMVAAKVIFGKVDSFTVLMEKCRAVEEQANRLERDWTDGDGDEPGDGSEAARSKQTKDGALMRPTGVTHPENTPLPSTGHETNRPKNLRRGGWGD